MIDDITLIKTLESLCTLQEKGEQFPCPRCGHEMPENVNDAALSRRIMVYICPNCGSDEAMRDITKKEPLPVTDWAMFM